MSKSYSYTSGYIKNINKLKKNKLYIILLIKYLYYYSLNTFFMFLSLVILVATLILLHYK